MFTALDDMTRMSDGYITLKVRELTRWFADAKDDEWKQECAAQLIAFRAELTRRGIA